MRCSNKELGLSWPDPVEVRLGLACAEQLEGDPARAAALLAEAAELAAHPRHVGAGRLTLELAERLGAKVAWQGDPQVFESAAERIEGTKLRHRRGLRRAYGRGGGKCAKARLRWLTAVAAGARMLASAGQWVAAADAYEALLGSTESPSSPLTTFAPARSRLVSMLVEEVKEAVAAGDVPRVEAAHRRLAELGEASELLPLSVAAAHRNAGRLDEALEELETLRHVSDDTVELAAAGHLAGDVLLEFERPEEATAAYRVALETTAETALEDRAVLETRLGVAAATADETARALDLLRSAIAIVRQQEGRTRAAHTVIGACTDIASFAGTPPLLPMTLRALLEDREVRPGQRRRLASARFEVVLRASAWRRLSVEYKLLPLPSPRRRRQIFGLQVFRPITDKGITVLGLTYQSAELQKLRLHGPNVEFEVRFDRFDIWAISVKTGANSWLEVENRFGVPRGVSIWEWTGAARELLTVHARNAETDIDIVMEAINRRRNSGEALAARAEMGTDYASPKHIALLEKKVFMNCNLSEKDQGRSKQLAAMVSPEHPLAHGLDLLNDDLLDADTPPVGKQPDENAATTDQSGSGDYVEFD